MKGYFEKLLDNNLDALVQRYVVNGQDDKYGEFEGFLRHNTWANGDTLVWQSDFVALALGTMAQRGNAQAVKMLDWMDNFTSGRFIHGDDGFDPRFGSSYMFKVHGTTRSRLTTPGRNCSRAASAAIRATRRKTSRAGPVPPSPMPPTRGPPSRRSSP